MDERVRLTLEEAKKRLPPGKQVHTFRQAGPVLIGADWGRADLLEAMARWGVEESGPQASRANHGLVLIDDNGPLFIETREEAE